MADENLGIYQINSPALLAHPRLLEPVPFKDARGKIKGDPKYSALFVLKNDHPDIGPMKSMILAVAKAQWPDKDIIAEVKAGNLKMPFASGDKIADKYVAKLKAAGKEDDQRGDFQRGCTVFKSSSQYPPSLAVLVNKVLVDVTPNNKALHKGAFYFGTECFGRLKFKAYDAINEDGKPGVTAYLDAVVSLNRGKALAGRKSAAEAFKGVAGSLSTEDPTGTDDLGDSDGF